MSITTGATITSNSPINNRSSSTSANHRHRLTSFNTERFVNERYPKTCLEDIPSVVLEYPPSKCGVQKTRSRHSLRSRTQPATLTEISETEERIRMKMLVSQSLKRQRIIIFNNLNI